MESYQLFRLIAAGMGLVLLLDLISGVIRKGWTSEPMLALLLGFALGPDASGFIDLHKLGEPKVLLEHAAQLTLAIGHMGVALRIPPQFHRRFLRTLATVILLGMPLMWLSASAVAHFTVGLPLLSALLLGAILTPSDPVVSTAVVTGATAERNLPRRLRHTISSESGFNNGLAYPLVMLPIALMPLASPDGEFGKWVMEAWLKKMVLGIVIGIAMGAAAAWVMRRAKEKDTMEIKSFLSYTVALSLSTLAVAHLAGTNAIIAVFVAGVAFSMISKADDQEEEEDVQEAVNRFFTLPIFLLLGLAAPWKEWFSFGWGAMIFVLAFLFLRRPPAWLILSLLTPGLRFREMAFAGWFGPAGIAAIYFALHAERETGIKTLWTLASMAICASVIVHGATAAPLARVLGGMDRKAKDQTRRRNGKPRA